MKSKKSTVIHRTTSETLRLGDSDILSNHNPVRLSVQSVSTNSRKKSQTTSPSCSFQITGVSVTRCDFGEDSADDLDESHTDDISRVTDNETPSFSEDSRDTDDQLLHPVQVHNNSPAIPSEESSENKWAEDNDQNLGMGRFKVVKIESVAPFSRGRWTCFDYLDQTEQGPKVSYMYCNSQDKFSRNATSLIDGPDDDTKHKRSTKINEGNSWEPNCQENFLFPGTMIVPDHMPLFVPSSLSRPQKSKPRSSCPTLPNAMAASGLRNIRPVRPYLSNSISLDADSKVLQVGIEKKNINLYPCDNNTTTKDVCKADNFKTSTDNIINKNTGIANSNMNQEVKETTAAHVSASVSCTATIDTKIEHALDVVKNHLTHAVRLEVEELKIKINELVDRISYLEYENDLLRANVAPDVLATLGNSAGDK